MQHIPTLGIPSSYDVVPRATHVRAATHLFLVVLCLLPYSFARAADLSELPCHTIRSDADPIPTRYGSPLNLFDPNLSVAIRVFCDDTGSRRVEVGDGSDALYIYKYGYHTAGGERKRIELSGARPEGSWLIGSAQATLPESKETKGSVYAYMCRLVQGVWKCGCRDTACTRPMWQIQKYDTSVASTPTSLGTENDPELDESLLGLIKEMHGGISEKEMAALEKDIEESREKYSKEEYALYGAYTTHVKPGDSVVLTGYDLASKRGGPMQVRWGNVMQVTAEAASDGRSLRVVVPDLSPGKYALRVERDEETTPTQLVLWIKDDSLQAPAVTRVSPEVGKQGETFTIYGSGFAREHNDIMTTFGIIENVPSKDGTSLSFTYEPFKGFVKNAAEDPEFSVTVRVINAGGFDPWSMAGFRFNI